MPLLLREFSHMSESSWELLMERKSNLVEVICPCNDKEHAKTSSSFAALNEVTSTLLTPGLEM